MFGILFTCSKDFIVTYSDCHTCNYLFIYFFIYLMIFFYIKYSSKLCTVYLIYFEKNILSKIRLMEITFLLLLSASQIPLKVFYIKDAEPIVVFKILLLLHTRYLQSSNSIS